MLTFPKNDAPTGSNLGEINPELPGTNSTEPTEDKDKDSPVHSSRSPESTKPGKEQAIRPAPLPPRPSDIDLGFPKPKPKPKPKTDLSTVPSNEGETRTKAPVAAEESNTSSKKVETRTKASIAKEISDVSSKKVETRTKAPVAPNAPETSDVSSKNDETRTKVSAASEPSTSAEPNSTISDKPKKAPAVFQEPISRPTLAKPVDNFRLDSQIVLLIFPCL